MTPSLSKPCITFHQSLSTNLSLHLFPRDDRLKKVDHCQILKDKVKLFCARPKFATEGIHELRLASFDYGMFLRIIWNFAGISAGK